MYQYYDVPQSYKEHIVFCNERGMDHMMDYETYLDLQYNIIKASFDYVQRDLIYKVLYLKI